MKYHPAEFLFSVISISFLTIFLYGFPYYNYEILFAFILLFLIYAMIVSAAPIPITQG